VNSRIGQHRAEDQNERDRQPRRARSASPELADLCSAAHDGLALAGAPSRQAEPEMMM
jgi:hypothetical protein